MIALVPSRGSSRVAALVLVLATLGGGAAELRSKEDAPTAERPTSGMVAVRTPIATGAQPTVTPSKPPPKSRPHASAPRTATVPAVPERSGTPAGPAHATKAALPPIPLPRPGQRPAGHAPSTTPELLPGWLGEVCPAPGLPGRTEDGKRLTCTRDGDHLRWTF